MYALGNIEKFLKDHADEIPEVERTRILKACTEETHDGLMTGGVPGRVMPPEIAQQFAADFEANPEHIEIAYRAVSRASELDL